MKQNRWTIQKRFSMLDGFVILFLMFVLMQAIVGTGILPVAWLAGFLPGGATVINKMLVQQLFQTLLMIGMVLFFLRLRGATLRQIGLRPFVRPVWFVWAVLLGFVTFLVMLFVSAAMENLFPQWAEPQTATELIMGAESRWETIAVLVMVSVLAPFSEELVFRGYIYTSMRAHRGMLFSVVITSLLFGGMHYDLFRLLPLSLAGACFNLAVIRSDSLWSSIIMHGVWNYITAAFVLVV